MWTTREEAKIKGKKFLKACLGDTQKGKAEMSTTEEEEMDKENKSNLNLPLKCVCYRATGPCFLGGKEKKALNYIMLCFIIGQDMGRRIIKSEISVTN